MSDAPSIDFDDHSTLWLFEYERDGETFGVAVMGGLQEVMRHAWNLNLDCKGVIVNRYTEEDEHEGETLYDEVVPIERQ